MQFERTDEMLENMTMDSFGSEVVLDLEVKIQYKGNKLKAYAPKLNCYLQFPRKLRVYSALFICDATEATNNGRVFYRAYKNTIRDANNEVVG